eukprot:TRINITY_DN36330_c0_g1_i1.p1 TRINITY_DN36330_c0_g1~~TRINITY_DN36330_c0_g1_i1.p1  ORF type:complete len:407 (-),score=42.43 TRINITY_DN36330_c0_g1_i1:295-1515(-)
MGCPGGHILKFLAAGAAAFCGLLLLLHGHAVLHSSHGDSQAVAAVADGVDLVAHPLLPDQQAQVAACVVNVVQAVGWAGTGSIAVRNAQLKCGDQDPAVCTGLVNVVLLSYVEVASLVAGTVGSCSKTLNPQALCAARILCITSNVAKLLAGAAITDKECDFSGTPPPDGPKSGGATRKASCAFSVILAAGAFGAAGISLRQSLAHCANQDGVVAQPEACSVNILNIISALASVAAFTAQIVNNCPDEGNQHARCTTGITAMVSAIASISACAIASKTDCAPQSIAKSGQPNSLFGSALPDLQAPADHEQDLDYKKLFWPADIKNATALNEQLRLRLPANYSRFLTDKDKHGDHWAVPLSDESSFALDALHKRMAAYRGAHPDHIAKLLDGSYDSLVSSYSRISSW